MADIFKPPAIKYKDLEAVITTKLSYNVLPFNFRTDFVRVTEDSVLTPITISMRNKDLAFQEQDGVHTFVGHVLIIVTGINGRRAPNGTVEDDIKIDIPDSLFKQSLDGVHVYQRVIPLRPGRYKVDIVVKDTNSGNTGVINKALPVPRFPDDRLQ